MKKHTYDDFWLGKDMENMGHMFEYCDKFSREVYHKKYFYKLKFIKNFMKSNIRKEMEDNHPRLLSQSARDSFIKYIEVDCDGNIEQYIDKQASSKEDYVDHQLYWVGWAYAYIHHNADIPFAELIEKIPIETMLDWYYAGHEMNISVFYERVKESL